MSSETTLQPEVRARLTRLLQEQVPDLLAIYGFGSRIQGTANIDSDLDLSVLVAGYADPLLLWRLSGELADIAGCEVDLLDLHAAPTVMQYPVMTKGTRWWALDVRAALFESAILSEKTALYTARAGLLADIGLTGRVYAR